MTTFNTDHNNTELLDQELTTEELSQVSGGCTYFPGAMDPQPGDELLDLEVVCIEDWPFETIPIAL